MSAGVLLYKYLIDPLLSGLRTAVRNQIKAGSSALDIACGTGAMVFKLMDHCSSVTGIDLDLPKIEAARKEVELKGLSHLSFQFKDATHLDGFSDNQFDYAILSMAMHQFSPDLREGIIAEAGRVSEKLIIADYSTPSPSSLSGWLAVFIEFLAGKEHYSNYRHYQAHGGMPGLLERMDLQYEIRVVKGAGVFTVFTVEKG